MRLSHLDLTDKGIEGGRLTDLTVGLNWYMTTYLRFTSNYIHAFLDNPTQGNSGTDIFAMRFSTIFEDDMSEKGLSNACSALSRFQTLPAQAPHLPNWPINCSSAD
jgi:hypothetical protein